MHRHEFDRGDIELLKMLNHRRMGQSGVGAAQVLRYRRMGLGHALDVGLVDDRLVVGGARCMVGPPLEERVDHHAGHGVPQRVDPRRDPAAGRIVGFEVIGVERLGEIEVAVEGFAVRVEEQLAGVAAQSG